MEATAAEEEVVGTMMAMNVENMENLGYLPTNVTEVHVHDPVNWTQHFSETYSDFHGYCLTNEMCKEVIKAYEAETGTKFVTHGQRVKNFGELDPADIRGKEVQRLVWEIKVGDKALPNENIPCTVGNYMMKNCEYGGSKVDNKKKDVLFRASKKQDCPCVIHVKEVLKFPDYQCDGRKRQRTNMSNALRDDLKRGEARIEKRLYISLPHPEVHNHPIGEAQNVKRKTEEEKQKAMRLELSNAQKLKKGHAPDKKVVDKITELTDGGINCVSLMQTVLDTVRDEIIIKKNVAPSSQKYYPTKDTIANVMRRSLRGTKRIDQKNVELLVTRLHMSNPEDSFHFRASGEDTPPDLLYVHQTKWQQQILGRYGNYLCLLHSPFYEYNTAFTVFILYVRTNVNYVPVATLAVHGSPTEALEVIKEWNPQWKPKFFLTDFNTEVLESIETTFEDCEVAVSDHHQTHCFEEWLDNYQATSYEEREKIMHFISSIATADSQESLEAALQEFQEDDVMKSLRELRVFFATKWASDIKRWTRLLMSNNILIAQLSNDGLSKQKDEFIRVTKYLKPYNDCSLSEVLIAISSDYLPSSYRRYIEENLHHQEHLSHIALDEIPAYLKNRPVDFIKDQLTNMELGSQMCNYDINVIDTENGIYTLVFKDVQDGNQNVYLGTPACSCTIWRCNRMPCAHMHAIFEHIEEWSFDRLPDIFTKSPLFQLDDLSETVDEIKSSDNEFMARNNATKVELKKKCTNVLKEIMTLIPLVEEKIDLGEISEHLDAIYESVKTTVGKSRLPIKKESSDAGYDKATGRRLVSLPSKNKPTAKTSHLIIDPRSRRSKRKTKPTEKIIENSKRRKDGLEHDEIIVKYEVGANDDELNQSEALQDLEDSTLTEATEITIDPSATDTTPNALSLELGKKIIVKTDRFLPHATWLMVGKSRLSNAEKIALQDGNTINYKIVDYFQSILELEFPLICGLKKSYQKNEKFDLSSVRDRLQMHSVNGQYILSTFISGSLTVYHSCKLIINRKIREEIINTYGYLTSDEYGLLKVNFIRLQIAKNDVHSAYLAFAYAVALANGVDISTVYFLTDSDEFRDHLKQCLISKEPKMFPSGPSAQFYRPSSVVTVIMSKFCYCYSYKPDDKLTHCAKCDRWFHYSCVGIDPNSPNICDYAFKYVCENCIL